MAPLHVLLVDDEALARMRLRTLLQDITDPLCEVVGEAGDATEALALLHELQVHQVELELQAQELRESRAGLESDLRHYADLYRLQPAALLTLDAQRRLYEMNPAASALLGVSSEHAIGRPIDAYFCPDSVHRLATALAQAAAGVAPPPGALRLTLRPRSGPPCAVLLALGPDAVAQRHIASLLRAD